MAYQTRGRDPLIDSDMQAVIERRGKELIGLALLAAGLFAALALWSYSPDDPSWLSATDAPVQNWMGRFGAAFAGPVCMIVGWGGWGLALLALVWGVRLALHQGQDRLVSRLVFAPIWIVLLSLYAASLVPGAGWTHSFGLGGLFGDTVLGTMLGIVPGAAAAGLKTLSLLLGVAMVALGLFVLGFSRVELARALRGCLIGLVVTYDRFARGMNRGATGGLSMVQTMAERRNARAAERDEDRASAPTTAALRADDGRTRVSRAALHENEPPVTAGDDALVEAEFVSETRLTANREFDALTARETAPAGVGRLLGGVRGLFGGRGASRTADFTHDAGDGSLDALSPEDAPWAMTAAPAITAASAARPGLFGRMMRRSDPMPELVEYPHSDADPDMPTDDRIKEKIADVVRSRSRSTNRVVTPALQPITKGRGRGPDPLILPERTPAQRVEPPLTAGGQPPVPSPEQTPRIDPDLEGLPVDDAIAADTAFAPPAPSALDDARDAPRSRIRPSEPMPATFEAEAPGDADETDMVHTSDVAEEEEDLLPLHEAAAQSLPSAEPRRVVQPAIRKPVAPSTRARAEAEPRLNFGEASQAYDLPPLDLLMNPSTIERHHLSDEALEENARMLEAVLDDYGVKGEIVSVRPGPVVTMYELEPAPGLKASRVIGLADDIARSMSALSARVSTVPGRSVIGIELPNDKREMVVLREILAARDFGDSHMKLPLALGKDIGGGAMVANLAKMPHLLIAGTTGSGKSVAINTMILSLLYRLTPEDCRLIMIDPKMLELSVYDGIPHLLSPVVTDPKKAVVALKWVVGEMEERYRKMSKMGVRNIDGYNGRVADALAKGETFSRTVQTGFDDDTGEPVFETEEIQPEKMPYIVVIVDEMADLMMVAGKEIEACIQRLAQMARASGIHLIMATQRPSVDVITGTIKANFPTRISFQVTSKIDSRTILGEMGAEQLLGMGDMLYMAGGAKITRCHGPFVSDEEVEEIVTHLKAYGPPSYIGGVVEGPDEDRESDIDAVLGLSTGGNTDGEDALYDQAVAVVIKDRKCSTSYIQRKLAIGYNKAARLVEQMEDQGLVSPANHVGKREILVPEQA